jgi:two-component system, OmpR family, sensor kinase
VIRPIGMLQAEVRRYLSTGRRAKLTIDRRDELGALSEDLELLAGRLEAKAARNAEDASDLAHELKSPIAAVRTAAELLGGDGPLDAERRRRIGKAIDEAATRLSRSVESMLAIARLEESLGKIERSPIDLAQIAGTVAAASRSIAEAKAITIEARLVAAPISGNAPRLEELARNLVDNAIVFAKSKVVITVGASPPTLLVEDDGPGVPVAERGRIFTRFYSKRLEGMPPGTGLGLAIARAIAEAHGGHLELMPGEGARFLATFPEPN